MARTRAPPPPLRFKGFNRQPSMLGRWYDRLASFDVGALFARTSPPGQPRTIFLNAPLPADYYDKKGRVKKEHVYPTNQVITSKYTVFTFLPRNLLEQFRRIANIFFLGIAIMQFFPQFSTTNPFVQLLPLLVVLGMTAAKDCYEDVKRHQSDRTVNHTQVRVLFGGAWTNANAGEKKKRTFVRALVRRRAIAVTHADDDDIEATDPDGPRWRLTSWEDVRVGDVVKVLQDESLPADLLICATSEEENVAYVETKNLDGETSLKSCAGAPALAHLASPRAWAAAPTVRVECDRPDANMYRINAAIVTTEGRTPVQAQMTLLRGTVLRNTAWVVGVVLFTGADTKVVLNSGATPSKRSKVERQMNPQVFCNLVLLGIMAIALGVADSVLEQYYHSHGALWEYGADASDDNPQINGVIAWAFAFVIFHNLIPISLYISIEAVRTIQAAFIYFDKEMWYARTDQPTLARSWNLSDDLGQIEYIFSDKTGTLTQNLMVFRRCSVAGRAYGTMEATPALDDGDPLGKKKARVDAEIEIVGVASSSLSLVTSTTSTGSSSSSSAPLEARVRFEDALLDSDMRAATVALRSTHLADVGADAELARAHVLEGFFTVLALCHTVLTSPDAHTGALTYRAQSPDEAALVQAAADAGFVFLGREREVLRLRTPLTPGVAEYELLNILEFSSARKRMSVVVRALSGAGGAPGRLMLLSKGADNVIYERLRAGDEQLRAETEAHLDEFANEGLRTLTLAQKELDEEEYQAWNVRYLDASASLDAREDKLEDLAEEIEHGLTLLGATAIEDRLQDGVPETIADLRRAGIKIWVATGDKLETAIAIGYSTNLIPNDAHTTVVRGAANNPPVYEQLLRAVRTRFPEAEIPDGGAADPGALEAGLADNTSVDGPHPLEPLDGDFYAPTVLVIDGAALTQALSDDRHKLLFLTIATRCVSVVCCRVSPMQKALVTKLVREGLGVMTLAIGDGANDVSMIQAADIGIGISGEEGMQAVNSADYAIAQFRYLKRLLLVHGHWSYSRNGQMIVNFFYKNVVPNGVLWWFQIYAAWSSAVGFEYTSLLFWNTLWTVAPVVAMGVFDRVADDDVLMALPELYHFGRQGYWYNFRVFALYMFEGLYQSVIIFFFARYTYDTVSTRSDGFGVYIHEWSSTMFIAAVMIANLFNGINMHIWTFWAFFTVSLGIVTIWMFFAIYASIPPSQTVTLLWGNNHLLLSSAYFWLTLVLVIVLALAPRLLGKAIKACWYPDDLDIMRFIRKTQPHRPITPDALHPTSSTGLRRVDTHASAVSRLTAGARRRDHGFDFSQEEHGVAIRRMQSNLSEREAAGAGQPRSPLRRKGSAMLATLTRSMRKGRPPIPERVDQL